MKDNSKSPQVDNFFPEIIPTLANAYYRLLRLPNFKDWIEYWEEWNEKNETITKYLIHEAAMLLNLLLIESTEYKVLLATFDKKGTRLTEEEKLGWELCLENVYDKFVYDLPNHIHTNNT